jgi:hypothetical protein
MSSSVVDPSLRQLRVFLSYAVKPPEGLARVAAGQLEHGPCSRGADVDERIKGPSRDFIIRFLTSVAIEYYSYQEE